MMRQKSRKRPIRKRSFLLIELLLSVSLLLACFLPMIKTHVGIAKEEVKQVKAWQEELLVHEKFCIFKQQLHEHCYTWEELMKGGQVGEFDVIKLDQSTKHSLESVLLLSVTLCENKNYQRIIHVKKARPHTH